MPRVRLFRLALAVVIFTAVLLIATNTWPTAKAAESFSPPETEHTRGPGGFLVDHTLIFPDGQGGEQLIHFSRFGTFDWYFPCQFETGDWQLDADQTLQLTYDNPRFTPRAYKLDRQGDGFSLTVPEQGPTVLAQLAKGNRLPYG